MHRAGEMSHSHSHSQGNGRNVALPDEDERYARYWEDRERPDWERFDAERARGFDARNQGYPGAFEERYRDRAYQERMYGGPRGYDYGDGDRGGVRYPYPYGTGGARLSGHRGQGPAGYHRSDERIREAVCEAVTEDDRIDATHIDVSVHDGEVTLAGTVDERLMKRFAEDLVEHISGVKDVQNLLRIGQGR